MTKAGFSARFGAICIDAILFFALGLSLHSPLFAVFYVAYETLLVSQWDGRTIGKKILGIRVVAMGGGKPDAVKAFIRSVSKILSFLPLGLGFFWALWDDQRQAWHDKIADTYVVKV